MKEKIITALKTKYQRFGLSNEAVDRIASAKEKTVTKDEDIDAAIADAETMELIAGEVQKSADRERRARADLQKSFDDYKKIHPEARPQEEKPGDEEPEWAKRLREQNEALVARLDAQDKATKRKATYESILASAKINGCTDEKALDLTQRLFTLNDDESEEDAATRFKSEYDATMKKYFGGGAVPPKGGGGAPSNESDFKKMLDGFAESKGLGEKQPES